MATHRSRSAARSGGSKASGSRKSARSRVLHRGQEGMDKIDEEIELQKKRREQAKKERKQPFRFYVPVGETKEIVILDDKPDAFLYEHTMRYPPKHPKAGKWGYTQPCIDGHDTCPLCEELGNPSYVMLLSVLDLTPFTTSSGEEHEFSRKLMAVKIQQQKKFIRRYKKDGTLRGAIFECSRDGPKDAAIGNDIEYLETMDEEKLSNDYINTWVDRENKEHVENCGEPYDYDEIIPDPTAEELRALVGKPEAPSGNRRQTYSHLKEGEDSGETDGGDGWEKEGGDDEPPWEKEDETTKSGRRSRRSSFKASEDKPARRSRRSRQEEPEEEQEEPEESPRRGRASRGSGSGRTSRRTRRQ